MAQAAKNLKKQKVEATAQLELLPTAGHNPFWQSSLFNEVYLQNDAPVKFSEMWSQEESGPFQIFCNQFRNLCVELQDADFESWSERNTINRFIKPILDMLGYTGTATQEPWAEDEPFTVKENAETRTYKPDLIIVDDPKELKYIERKKGQEKIDEARNSVIVPVEAKYWGRIEDVRQSEGEDVKRADKKDQSDATRSLDFDEQCLKYMEILGKDFGILTDGRTWRLYHGELSSDTYRRNFQFNIGYLLKHVNAGLDRGSRDYQIFIDNAKYFFHIFSKKALHSASGERLFVDDLLEYSKKYVSQFEDDLKSRFVKAMSIACNGYLRSHGDSKSDVDLGKVRNVSESQLFNILFIRYCESKNILPMKDANYRKISISSTIDKLTFYSPEKEEDDLNLPNLKRLFKGHFDYRHDGTELYERILSLTKIVQVGTKAVESGFEIAGFRESIFSADESKFVQSYPLLNSEMVHILFELGYCESKPGKYQQIPYNFFSPRQLGSIYESFLEFKLERATEDMAFIKKQWSGANLKSDKIKSLDVPKVKKGRLFFSPDNEDRKATGSYYTPDSAVQLIVSETLGPIVFGLKAEKICNLRICDPAMGSGHFLSATLNYLARAYLAAVENETNDDLNITITRAKRKLLHTCIFGADLNSRAVKLAKMSLWLESAEAGHRLEELDDQIKCANSLTDRNLWAKEWNFISKGIDAVVGNPPYLGEKGNRQTFQEITEASLGQRFYMRHMDLLYFFFHLGLDILKPGGRLGFITTNYFLTADGAKLLRKDLHDRSAPISLVNLNEMKVFGDASGQHNLITIVEKSVEEKPCLTLVSNSKEKLTHEKAREISRQLRETRGTTSKKDLFYGENYLIRMKVSAGNNSEKTDELFESALKKIGNQTDTVKKYFHVNQGIVTGANKVADKHFKKYPGLKASKGDGIFVFTNNELDALSLDSIAKKRLIRPFFKSSDIQHVSVVKNPKKWLLFSNNIQKLSDYPSVKKHLEKYKAILEGRSQMEHCLDWWDLHQIRTKDKNKTGESKKMIFDGPKIASPIRSRGNRFGYSEGAWYGASDITFITPSTGGSMSLKCLSGVLNSATYYTYFYFRGKRKGEALELISSPISSAHLPTLTPAQCAKIEKSVDGVLSGKSDFNECLTVVDSILADAFGFTAKELSAIRSFYDSKIATFTDSDDSEDDDESAA